MWKSRREHPSGSWDNQPIPQSEEQPSKLSFVFPVRLLELFYFRDHELGLIATLGSCRVKLRPLQTEQTDKWEIRAWGVEYKNLLNLGSHLDGKDISLIPEMSSSEFVLPLRCGVVFSRRYILHSLKIASTSPFASEFVDTTFLNSLISLYTFIR